MICRTGSSNFWLWLYWWNPVLWLLRHEIRFAEERACDAWVVARRPERRTYAEVLVKIMGFLSSPDVPSFTSGVVARGSVEERIGRIMREAAEPRLSHRNQFVVCLLALLLLPLAPTFVRAEREINKVVDLQESFATVQIARTDQAAGEAVRSQDRTPGQERALALLKDVGASVEFDESRPGRPVRTISLADEQVTEATLSCLKEFPSLEQLGIRGRNLTDAGMVHVRGLTSLKKFLIGDCQVTDEGLVNLEGLTRLEWVSLGSMPLTGPGLRHLQKLPRLGDLFIVIDQPLSAKFRNESLSIVADFPSLKFLSIACAGLSDAGLERLKGMNRLRTLFFLSDAVTDAGLAQLEGLTSLENLQASSPRITDTGLVHLRRMSKLRSLNLYATHVGDEGVVPLLGIMNDLEMLGLSDTRISDETMKEVRKLHMLTSLSVDGTRVTDAGLASLEAMTDLATLSLSGTRITDLGLVHLKPLKKLRWLFLDGTEITEAGLASLDGLTSLVRLSLDPALRNSEGVKALQRTLPRLRIDPFTPRPSRSSRR